MAYPYSTINASKTDITLMAGDHAPHHNALANALNDLLTELGSNPSGAAADLTARLALLATLASPAFSGTPTAPTASLGTNTTQLATTAFVAAAVAALVNSAPGVLDTLDELAAALGDDANFAATMTAALAAKAGLVSPAFTGNPTSATAPNEGDNDTSIPNTLFLTRDYRRRKPLTTSITSSATPTFNVDTCDILKITALATNITSMTSGKSGTPGDQQKLEMMIKDDGSARSIAFGADYLGRYAALPAATIPGKWMRLGFVYDLDVAKWVLVAVVNDA